MIKWGTKSMKRLTFLSLAGVMALSLAGCGGSSSGTTTTTDTTIEGVTNPVQGATVTVMDNNGDNVDIGTVTTDNDGAYSATLPSTLTSTDYPLIITFAGGTDSLTGEASTVDLKTVGTEPDSTTVIANAFLQTTMLVEAAIDAGTDGTGFMLTDDLVSTASANIGSAFGMGIGSDLDTLLAKDLTDTANVDDYQRVLQSSQSAKEMVRRVTVDVGDGTTSDMGRVLSYFAKDAGDGSFDGKDSTGTDLSDLTVGGNVLTPSSLQSDVIVTQAEVALEAVMGTLTVSGASGTAIAMDTALAGVGALSSKVSGGVVEMVVDETAVTEMVTIFKQAEVVLDADEEGKTGTGQTAATVMKNLFSAMGDSLETAVQGGTTSFSPTSVNTVFQTELNTKALAATGDAQVVLNALVTSGTADSVKTNLEDQTASLGTVAVNDTVLDDARLSDAFKVTAISVTDYPSSGEVMLSPDAPSVMTGDLTANFTTALDAANLNTIIAGTASGDTNPLVKLTLDGTMPVGGGTVRADILLKDGTSVDWTSGQRLVSFGLNLDWSSTGTAFSLSTKAGGEANVTSAAPSSPALAKTTLVNSAVDVLGTNSSGTEITLDLAKMLDPAGKIGQLIGTVSAEGNYFYKISIHGFPVVYGSSSEDVKHVMGTFTVE